MNWKFKHYFIKFLIPLCLFIVCTYLFSTKINSFPFQLSLISNHKIQILWEGHKIRKNLPHVLTKQLFLLSSVKTSGRFFQIFVAFSEKLSFNPMTFMALHCVLLYIPWKNEAFLNQTENYRKGLSKNEIGLLSVSFVNFRYCERATKLLSDVKPK